MGGPFIKEVGNFYGAAYSKRTWRTQAKPYVKPLAFEFWSQASLSGDLPSYNYQPVLLPTGSDSQLDLALANAMGKFRDELGEAAGVAINAAQYAQTRDMIVNRATQLVRAARQIRKGQFAKAAKTFGVTQPKGATRKQQFASNWLEYVFGWLPIISDIHAACSAFTRPIPAGKVRGQASIPFTVTTGYWPPSNAVTGRTGVRSQYRHRVRIGAEVHVTNPNLWLANQLGVLNPAQVAWDAVPFSFVVDWFYDIGSFLESLTSMAGLEIKNGFMTRTTSLSREYWACNVAYEPPWKPILKRDSGASYIQVRSLGVPAYPSPSLRTPGISLKRCATAISLVIQQLR